MGYKRMANANGDCQGITKLVITKQVTFSVAMIPSTLTLKTGKLVALSGTLSDRKLFLFETSSRKDLSLTSASNTPQYICYCGMSI